MSRYFVSCPRVFYHEKGVEKGVIPTNAKPPQESRGGLRDSQQFIRAKGFWGSMKTPREYIENCTLNQESAVVPKVRIVGTNPRREIVVERNAQSLLGYLSVVRWRMSV